MLSWMASVSFLRLSIRVGWDESFGSFQICCRVAWSEKIPEFTAFPRQASGDREEPLALNCIGTHPVENMFGLVRIRCKSKHGYTAFLRAFSKNMMMVTILKATVLSSSVRRDYSITGSNFNLVHWPDRTYLDPIGALQWMQLIRVLLDTCRAKMAMKEAGSRFCVSSLPQRALWSVWLNVWFNQIIKSDQYFHCPARSPTKQFCHGFWRSWNLNLTVSGIFALRARSVKFGHSWLQSKSRMSWTESEIIGCQDNNLIEMMNQN
jgi:hypothetical protein